MMKEKKILFVISSLDTGGAQRAVSNLTTHFPESWDIDILLNSDEHIVYPYRGNIISLGIDEPKDRSGLWYQAKVFFKRLSVLRQLKTNRRYCACISFLFSANVANIVTGKKYCRVITSVRCTLSEMKPTIKKKLIIDNGVKVLFNKSDMIVSLSKGTERDLHKNYYIHKDKTCVIYNGYDIESIVEKATEIIERKSDKSFIIATMGRLDFQKGQWHLIRCVYYLKTKYPMIKLLILGEGPLRTYFEQMIQEGGLEQNVYLKGFCDNPFPYIKNSDVFVFPSLFEGFGNVLVEAMACEVPCIAADFRSGAREIMAPNTDVDNKCIEAIEYARYGILTPVCGEKRCSVREPLDKEELLLCDAIEKMIIDERIKINYINASKKRAKDFSIETAVNEWIEIIEKVTKGN